MVIEKLQTAVGGVHKYLGEAVKARETFYQGMREAAQDALTEKHPNMGPSDARYRFGQSQQGKQLIADNKWHMEQARSFGIAAIATGILELVYLHKQSVDLLRRGNELARMNNDVLAQIKLALQEKKNG